MKPKVRQDARHSRQHEEVINDQQISFRYPIYALAQHSIATTEGAKHPQSYVK